MDETAETLQSKTFDWVRFPLIAFIIFHHFSYKNIYDANGFFYYLEYAIGGLLASIGVPIFFFISGYLFFKKGAWDKNTYIAKVKKRIGTLAVPYLLWNTITVAAQLVAQGFKCQSTTEFITYITTYPWLHAYWDINHFGNPTNWMGFNAWIHTPANDPLWFLRDLFFACLLAPVSHWVVKKLKFWGVALLCAIFVADIVPQVPALRFMAFCFFTFGAYFSINHKKTVVEFTAYQWYFLPLSILIFTFLLFSNGYWGTLRDFLLSILIVLAAPSAIVIVSTLLKNGWTKVNPLLALCAFFVYAMHRSLPLSHFLNKINDHLFHPEISPWVQFIHFMFVPTAIILIDIAAYHFLKRFMPRTLSLLTGNRRQRTYK